MHWNTKYAIGLFATTFCEGEELGKSIAISRNEGSMLGVTWAYSYPNNSIIDNVTYKIAMGWDHIFFYLLYPFSIGSFMPWVAG